MMVKGEEREVIPPVMSFPFPLVSARSAACGASAPAKRSAVLPQRNSERGFAMDSLLVSNLD